MTLLICKQNIQISDRIAEMHSLLERLGHFFVGKFAGSAIVPAGY